MKVNQVTQIKSVIVVNMIVLRLKNQFGNAEIWCHIKQTKIDFHNMKLQKYFHYICYMYNIGELYMGIRIFYVP